MGRTLTPTYRRLAFALYSFSIFGTIGILIDGDHLVSVLLQGLPLNPATILLYSSRIWHWPSVIVSGSILLAIGACYLGLLCTGHAILDEGF